MQQVHLHRGQQQQKKQQPQQQKAAQTKTKAAASTKKAAEEDAAQKAASAAIAERRIPESVIWLIADSILDLADTGENDYVSLGAVGQLIQKKRPDFDTRSYGFSKLSSMVKAIDRFEVIEQEDKSDPRSKIVYIRDLEM